MGNLAGAFGGVLRHFVHLLNGNAHMLNALGLFTGSQGDFSDQHIGFANFGLDLTQGFLDPLERHRTQAAVADGGFDFFGRFVRGRGTALGQ